mmetsp:Transcript_59486/g.140797  ORF Transcript_59486/g.140797 Transcript_59486/m.140797 type:complete len:93 (-) Transcript_59486:102-380(-)
MSVDRGTDVGCIGGTWSSVWFPTTPERVSKGVGAGIQTCAHEHNVPASISRHATTPTQSHRQAAQPETETETETDGTQTDRDTNGRCGRTRG